MCRSGRLDSHGLIKDPFCKLVFLSKKGRRGSMIANATVESVCTKTGSGADWLRIEVATVRIKSRAPTKQNVEGLMYCELLHQRFKPQHHSQSTTLASWLEQMLERNSISGSTQSGIPKGKGYSKDRR